MRAPLRLDSFDSIERAVEAIARGGMAVVVDHESRENEGDLVMAAAKVTPEAVNFMLLHGRGLVCVSLPPERADTLQLPPMAATSTAPHGTAFTVSVDAAGVRTGISAQERALTIQRLVDPATRPDDLTRPGHVFPLRAVPGGVLARPGHTEASLDLARLAGLYPAGVLCEILGPDGRSADRASLFAFAARHGLPIVSIQDLIRYRLRTERTVRRVAEAALPTRHGRFRAIAYESLIEGAKEAQLALVAGEVGGQEGVLTRVHSECLTGDVLGSLRCDCGDQLREAERRIQAEGSGVLIYLRQEGRGIGLLNKVRAYALQDQGQDTVEANLSLHLPADAREYSFAAQILRDLGVASVRLLTNNPAKVSGLEAFGVRVAERLPLEVGTNPFRDRYLRTKREKLGHLLSLDEGCGGGKRAGSAR